MNNLNNYTKIKNKSIFDNKKIIMFIVLIIIILIFVSSMSISFSKNNNTMQNKKTNQTNQAINNQLNKDNGLHSMNNNNGMFYKTKIKSITPSLNSQINDKENQYYY